MIHFVRWRVSGILGTWAGISIIHPAETFAQTAIRAFERNSGLKVASVTADRKILVIGEEALLRLSCELAEQPKPKHFDRIQNRKNQPCKR